MFKTIALPKLDRLNPTVISTVIKLVEEMGELAEVVYKQHSNSDAEQLSKEVCLILKMVIMTGRFARAVGKHKGLNGEILVEEGPDLSQEMRELTKVMDKFQPALSPDIQITEDNYLQELTTELFDVSQSAITFMFILENIGVNINKALKKHIQKMRDKGYLE